MDYPSDVMTDSERLPSNAVHEITWICHVVTSMWESGVLVGIVEYLDTNDLGLDIEVIRTLMKMWKHDLEGLMQWLDWNT